MKVHTIIRISFPEDNHYAFCATLYANAPNAKKEEAGRYLTAYWQTYYVRH